MVDLISHKVIDLIPSRKTEDVQSWLATFPNLSIISRDGAQHIGMPFQSHINKQFKFRIDFI